MKQRGMTTTLLTGTDTEQDTAVARTAGLVSLVILAVGLGGIALDIEWAWIVFPVGYGGVLPLAVSYVRSQSRGGESDDRETEDPLATLRERYARGEIDDVEFERRAETLLETEEGRH